MCNRVDNLELTPRPRRVTPRQLNSRYVSDVE